MSARARGSLLLATLILAFPVARAANNEPSYTNNADANKLLTYRYRAPYTLRT